MHLANDKRVHEKEARSLKAAGFDVIHICPGDHQVESLKVSVLDGVHIHQYAVSSEGLWARLGRLLKLYKLAAAARADVYHCNEVDSWGVGIALRIFRSKKCVFDVHEHYPSTFAQQRFPGWLQPAVAASIRLVFAILLPFTDRIVLAKSTVGEDFKCRADKKFLVQNFTPLSSLEIVHERAPRTSDSPMTIVHLGLFGRSRGWPQVLEALAMSHDCVQLQVIGTINDGTHDMFEERVSELGLQDRVSVFEWMPFEQAFKLMMEADVGLIAFQPHIQNNIFAMPHKLFDYMAAGMAVLMPKQALEVAPIVDDTGCGLLIDPSDPDDLALGINRLMENPIEAHRMGERGQEAVKRTYNWESEARVLINMYNGLV